MSDLYAKAGETWLRRIVDEFRRLNSTSDHDTFLASNCFFGTITFSRRRIDQTRAALSMNNASAEIEYEEFDQLYRRILRQLRYRGADKPNPLAIVGLDFHGTRLATSVSSRTTDAHLHFILAFTDAQREHSHQLLTPFGVKYWHRRLMSHVDGLLIERYDLSRGADFRGLSYATKAFLRSHGGGQVSDPLHIYGDRTPSSRYRTKRAIPVRRTYDEQLVRAANRDSLAVLEEYEDQEE